ncbi:MAG: hypothetical protein JXQ73_25785 [Phycisphaerae bacterium]|nr:hypothetical protein [Phycisphaerae bacterium]
MAVIKKTEIVLDHKFDPKACRHSLGGATYVLHCHHYATLYTQLADDCGMLDGKKLLAEVSGDVFGRELSRYYECHGIEDIADRIAIAEQYYAVAGLGQMKVICAGPEGGEVELLHSHVDEGWIKKWGKRDKPVNFITCGYIAGVFAAVFDRDPRTYQVGETDSIVTGADRSKFQVVAR